MPYCPHCGKQITYLTCYMQEYNQYKYNGEYSAPQIIEIYNEGYYCPHCNHKLATTEDEANTILTEEDPGHKEVRE